MALDAYLRITGETQGEVVGGVIQAGREGSMEIIGWSHEIVSPRDRASGQPTGSSQHQPMVVTKPIDRATVPLQAMLASQEHTTEWELTCWEPSRSGKEVQFYTIRLSNASIAGIRQEQLNNTYQENQPLAVREHVSFTYQTIEWTWEDGGLTATDDWAAPSA